MCLLKGYMMRLFTCAMLYMLPICEYNNSCALHFIKTNRT